MLKEVIQKIIIPAVHIKTALAYLETEPNLEHPHLQDLEHILIMSKIWDSAFHRINAN